LVFLLTKRIEPLVLRSKRIGLRKENKKSPPIKGADRVLIPAQGAKNPECFRIRDFIFSLFAKSFGKLPERHGACRRHVERVHPVIHGDLDRVVAFCNGGL